MARKINRLNARTVASSPNRQPDGTAACYCRFTKWAADGGVFRNPLQGKPTETARLG